MRTTVDLPDELHRATRAIAHDTHQTLSAAIVMLIRRGLGEGASLDMRIDETTGFPVVRLGTTITAEDVRSLDDDE